MFNYMPYYISLQGKIYLFLMNYHSVISTGHRFIRSNIT